MAHDIIPLRLIGATGLAVALGLAATAPAAAFGRGGTNGEADTYLRQELHNPGYLNSRPTRFNNSRPWPEQYVPPAPTYYGPPAYYAPHPYYAPGYRYGY